MPIQKREVKCWTNKPFQLYITEELCCSNIAYVGVGVPNIFPLILINYPTELLMFLPMYLTFPV